MTETQMLTVLVATVPTILVVLISLLVSNARLSDIRDLLRAEIGKSHSELLMKLTELDARIDALDSRLSRIEARFASAGQHAIPGT